MSYLLRIEAHDPTGATVTIADATQAPVPLGPALLEGYDWGNAVFEAQVSGPRGTLGRVAQAYQAQDRRVTLPVRWFGTSKDDLADKLTEYSRVVDLVRRYGGRIVRRSHGQTYRQYLEVLSTAGVAVGWTRRGEISYRCDTVTVFTCAPFLTGEPFDIVDEFLTDTRTHYTFDAGALGNVVVTGGVLDAAANLTTENRLIHTESGYSHNDMQVTVTAQPGTTLTSFKCGAIVKRVDVANYLEVYVDDNGTNSRLRLDKIVAGARTLLATVNLAARIVTGSPFTVRGRIERNTVYAEHFLGDTGTPAGIPTTSLTAYTLTTAEAAVFGVAVPGRGGIVFLPQHTDAAVLTFGMHPFTYRAAALPDTFRVGGIPGDQTALMSVSVARTGAPTPTRYALIGWCPTPSPTNLLEMDTFYANVLTAGWEVAASTSRTHILTQAKYGVGSIEVTCVSGNASSGVQKRTYRRYRRGVPYTFRVWVRSSTSTADVQVRFGDATANDVATSGSTALSTAWQQLSVTWTPTVDRADAHITVFRVTAGAADVFQFDGEEVYEGTVAPSTASQINGRGAPPAFGLFEAENTRGATAAVDADASSGFVAQPANFGLQVRQAAVTVDPTAFPAPDGSGVTLTEVWGRVRIGGDYSSLTAVASVEPYSQDGSTPTYTLEHGSAGRSVYVPLGSTIRSRWLRFGTLPIPNAVGQGRVLIQARLDAVGTGVTSTGPKTAAADETDSNGTWTGTGNTASSNDAYADAPTIVSYSSWRWKTFAFGLPGGSTIQGIEVKAEANSTFTDQSYMFIEFSPDGGTTRSGFKKLPAEAYLTGTDQVITAGGPTDLWGFVWTDDDFSDANFRVIVYSVADGSQNAKVRLDHLTVNVYYSPGPPLPGIDQLLLTPSSSRAVTKTGDLTSPTWIPSTVGKELEKVVAPDLSATLGPAGSSNEGAGMFPSAGLGGSLLEIPTPSTDVVVKISDLTPDEPQRSPLSESLTQTASVHFSVTPRWAVLRDA